MKLYRQGDILLIQHAPYKEKNSLQYFKGLFDKRRALVITKKREANFQQHRITLIDQNIHAYAFADTKIIREERYINPKFEYTLDLSKMKLTMFAYLVKKLPLVEVTQEVYNQTGFQRERKNSFIRRMTNIIYKGTHSHKLSTGKIPFFHTKLKFNYDWHQKVEDPNQQAQGLSNEIRDEEVYFFYLKETNTLIHEEHDSIELPPGFYEMRPQMEFRPASGFSIVID